MVRTLLLTTIHIPKNSFNWFSLFFLLTTDLYAIPNFTEFVVSTSADGISSVYAVDVDGDGDLDIISASLYDDRVAWYENTGTGYTTHEITSNADGATAVHAIDVDNDGDVDILSASILDDKISWYENDGNESFTVHTISDSMLSAYDVYAVDIDNDSDIDVLGAAYDSDQIVWFENNGSESFTSHIITSNADGSMSVYTKDVDNDGDMDILSASILDDKISWYENDGNESFTAHTISTTANGANTVYASDVDSDGDIDVLSSSMLDNKIVWYENDGNESFTTHTLSSNENGARDVYALDLDLDGDVDVLSASQNDGKIRFYENNGSESFTAHQITPSVSGIRSLSSGDMDGDGDIDIIGSAFNLDKVAVYLNESAPLVTSVTSTKANGSYGVGTNISIIVNFSDQVLVTGTPQLTLETGATDAVLNYSNGSSTGQLLFDYIVAAGESSNDLDYISSNALVLNGGTIKDSSNNNTDANLTLPTPGAPNSLGANKDIVIETTAPTVTSVSSTTADGTYAIGDTIDVSITFNEIVNVSSGTIGCGDFLISSLPFTAQYSTAAQPNNWDVTYGDGSDIAYTLNLTQATTISVTTCAAYTDYDTKLEIFTASGECLPTTTSYYNDDYTCTYNSLGSTLPSCVLEAGTYYIIVDGYAGATGNYQIDITDVSGRNENGNDTANGELLGDYNRPDFSSAMNYDSDYELNKLRADGFTPLEIQQMLNETPADSSNISRTGGIGIPKITMETGIADSAAYYVSGSGTTTISFQYVILSGDSSSDLDYVSTSALVVNSGIISDIAGNDAILTLPTPGSAGSLAYNNALVVDGFGPVVYSVSSTVSDSTYDVGSVIPITITFDEIVLVDTSGGKPQIVLETGAADAVVNYTSGSGTSTLIFNYTSGAGENSSDLDYQDTTALILNGGTITDLPGNPGNLILPVPGTAGSLGANKEIIIDGGAPIVYTITSTAADGTYNLDDIIPITITFSETMLVTGVPQLEINTGGTSLNFDGNGDYATSGTSLLSNLSQFTMAGWINAESAGNRKGFFGQNNRIEFGFINSTRIQGWTASGGSVNWNFNNSLFPFNVYHHVVIVGSGSNLKLYVDGSLKATGGSNTANYGSNGNLFNIGGGGIFDGSGNWFNGLIDEVAVWNIALADSEITALYNNGASISAAANSGAYSSVSNLLVYYTMDEGHGSTMIDQSISSIDGTIYNATWGPSTLRGDTVNYSSGNGTSALTFNYTVASNHQTTDLDYTRSNALFLNGGTIKESSGNDAILSLPLPGTIGSLGWDKDIIIDGKVPTVTVVTSSTDDGFYGISETIIINVNLDDVVTVTGTPQLTLETGISDATINYASGSGTSMLTFNYTVAEGDTNSDLAYQSANALALNSGTIRDAAGNDANLTLPPTGTAGSLSAEKALIIDGVVPTIANVTSNVSDSTYNVGDTLDIIVQFGENMTVGTASLGCGDFLINSLPYTHSYYNTGQGDNWDVNYGGNEDVAYTLHLYEATSISVSTCNAGTNYDTKIQIFTASGECVATATSFYNDDYSCTYSNLYSTLPNCLLTAGTYYIVVDGFSSSNGNYTVTIEEVSGRVTAETETESNDQQYEIDKLIADGYQEWEIRDMIAAHDIDQLPLYTFSRTGSGTPQLILETGISDAVIGYFSGSGTPDLSFRYIVEMGHNSTDLDYDSTNALDLNNGVITDAAGNSAILILPVPGTTGSLGANKDIVIDGGVPLINSVTSSVADGNYVTGNVIPINVVFNENVTVTDTPQVKLSTGGYALDLDGTDDYAFVPNNSSLQFGTGDFSVSTWFKIDAIGGTKQIFCKRGGGGNYEIQVNSAGRLSAWAPNGFSGSTVLSANTWYNVTLTRISGTSYLYLNGVMETSRNNVGNQNSTNGLSIGRDSYGGERFNGNIDEFAIWNSGLSAAEALVIYNNNATIDLTRNSSNYTSSSNLVAYLRMNEGTGITVMDATGNGHNATLNNGATWDESQLGGTDVSYTSGSGTDTLTFNYTVLNGDFSSDLDYTDTTALSLNGGAIMDDGGNDAILILPIPGLTGSLSANKNLVVDGNIPKVTNVTSNNLDETYSNGDSIFITLSYSETVMVTGTPQLLLETGLVNAIANYSSGSSSSILTFLYIVAVDDSSADLDYTDTTALSLNGGTIKDNGGNDAILTLPVPGSSGSLGGEKALVVDGIIPGVSTVSSSTEDGIYSVGDSIDISVNFSEAVLVSGIPQLILETGESDAVVIYSGGSGTPTLIFRYTIAGGNTSNDLNYIDTTALVLNGGMITDAAGNSANLFLPYPDSTGSLSQTKDLVVDGGPPQVISVSSTAIDSSYIIGDTIAVTINFSESVTVTGTPKLTLETGDSNAVIYYSSGSGTAILNFKYTIASGHISSDLNYIDTTSLALNGGTIRDIAQNNAKLTLPDPDSTGALGVNKSLLIDGIVPMVNEVTSEVIDGLYKLGDTLAITISFSEPMIVSGIPQLTLETGNNDAVVNYYSGSGTSILTFQYVVTAGDSTGDLDYVGVIALGLNSGSVKDAAGNNATLTLPEPGTSGSLGYARVLVIDGIVPTIYSVTSTVTDSVFKIADIIPILVTLSENVTVDTSAGKPQITLETGTTDAAVDYASGSGSSILTFNYTVASGHNSIHLDYVSDSALTLNGSTITDAAGSATYLTLAVPGVAGSLAADKTLFIDGVSPVVTSVSSNAPDTTYIIADTIGITVTFNEAVIVTGTPQLTMETGDTDAVVDYSAGSGSNVLTFNYFVTNGHSSTDLDYVSTSALALNSGTILDAVGNPAILNFPEPGSAGSLSYNKTIALDAEPPAVTQMISTNSNGSYKMGDTLTIAILFNEKVLVTGTPQLTLETGTNDALADYLSGNDTTMISFRYFVAAGHVNPDLGYVSTTALALNNGTITDAAGNNATLTLPAPGASFSLSSNMNLNVEGVLPAVPTGLITTPGNGQIKLDWTANLDNDLASYKVYGSTVINPTTLLATITTGTEAYTQTGLTNGTIYYYRISALDNVGNKSSETSNVTALAHELSMTSSLNFDGTDDYAVGDASTDFDIVNEFTVSAWIKSDVIANGTILNRMPYSGGNGYRLNIRDNGEIWAMFGSGETNVVANTSSNYYSAGVDYLVSGVYKDGNYVKLYVNGNLMESVTTDISFNSNVALELARWVNTAGEDDYFDGNIDEIGVWNKALSAAELLTLYTGSGATDLRINSGNYSSADQLQAYWRFSESTGFTLYDIGGKGHHNTFTGAVWNTDVIDVTAPNVTSASAAVDDGLFGIGDTIIVNVSFNEAVMVTGVPQLTVETGTSDAVLDYASGTGSATLNFSYIVSNGESSSDLDYVGTTSLALNGGTIKDVALNNADLTLPEPDSTGSLAATKNIVVDGNPATVTEVSSSTQDGTYNIGDMVAVTIAFNETVMVNGSPQITLETGATDAVAGYTAGTGTSNLTFNYTVGLGHENSDLEYNSNSALALNSGRIKDVAGNNATLTLPEIGGTGSLATNKSLVIDGVAPTVNSVSANTVDGYYKTGDTLLVTITFSEIVAVTGVPQLVLETGSNDAVIYYTNGSGTSTLNFNYIIELGQNNSDLDYVNTNSLSLNNGLIRDIAGNDATLTLVNPGASGSLSANKALMVDAIVPTVSSVSSTTPDSTYNIGDTLVIIVNFPETVVVDTSGGKPQLTLETGSLNAIVDYTSGSGSTALSFQYIIVQDHTSDHLDYTGSTALSLAGGLIQDSAGNNAILTLPVPGSSGSLSANKALVVDGVIPTIVSSISTTLVDGTYKIGDTLGVAINFSEIVNVTGIPQLTMETGNADGIADYTRGSGTNTLVFNYIVSSGHNSLDLDYANDSALVLNNGTIIDPSGNDADLTLPIPGSSSSFSANKAIIIDGIVPTVENISSPDNDGILILGSTTGIIVTLSEVITVTGSPQLTLETGTNDAILDYTSGSGSATLTFNYTVAAGHVSGDLDYTTSSALTLNGGTINDVAGNDATLTLFATGGEGSLGANKNFVVDGIVPTISNVSASNNDGLFMINDSITITVIFTESVSVTGTPQLNLQTSSATTLINYLSGSGSATLSFEYIVASGDSSIDLGYENINALTLNGGLVKDTAGNNAILNLSTPGTNGSLAANKELVIDGMVPVVNTVSSTTSDGTYNVGDTLNISVNFSEPVFITGVPQLTLETGDANAVANYSSGSGDSIIDLSYIVFEGQSTNDLDYTGTNAFHLNGGTIMDAAGNNVVLALPEPDSTGSLSNSKDLNIDGILPYILSATSHSDNGTYIIGDTVDISFSFSEVVYVSGIPQLTLETGDTDAVIDYYSGSGSNGLVFRFFIENGHNSTDLDYVSDSALVLNGGAINDLAGNGSFLNLPEPGSSLSVSGSKAIFIDGDIPDDPTGLIATPGLGRVDLAWSPNTENDLAHYKIFTDTTSNPNTFLTTVAIGTEKYTDAGLNDGIIRYYRVSAVDLVGNESQSQSTSTVFAMPHDPGTVQCLSFDGDDDYIQTSLSGNMLPLTISVLFKPDINIGEQSIVDSDIGGSYGQSLILGYMDNDNTVDVQYHNGYYDTPFTYSPDKWYHAVAVYDSGSVGLYMNGELVGSKTFTQATPDGSNFRIGRHNSGDPQWYDGKIDEIIIWNDTLSLSEIQAINNNPLDIDLKADSENYLSSSNVMGYWKFGESSGSVVYDISGNGNHGTIDGASWDSEGVDMIPPAKPEGLVATASNSQVTLSWNQNTEADLYQYLIYGGTDPFPSVIVATNSGISNTTVTISNLQNDTTYYYRISAIDYASLESEKTLDISIKPVPQKYEVSLSGNEDFTSIQTAVNFAADDDTLIVNSGIYFENINLLSKALIIGSDYFVSGDTTHISNTVIDAQSIGPAFTISNASGPEVKLIGFTIRNGSGSDGGAIYSSNSSLVLDNVVITGSVATNNGGGIFLNGGDASLTNVTVTNNTAANNGGGIYLQNSATTTINQLTVSNNTAINGGGISMNSSNPIITSFFIFDNNADSTGGAVAVYSNSNPVFYNAVIYDNYAGLSGGAMQISRSNPIIRNSTIVSNHGDYFGGGLYLTNGSEVVVTNSILYENIPEQFFINDPEDLLTVSFSDVEGDSGGVDYSHVAYNESTSLVTWAQSNINVDPLFSDANNDEYSLSNYSMAIGVGSSVNSINSDIIGSDRPVPIGSDPDMGAYENLRSIPDVWLTLTNDQFFINEDSTLLFNPVLNDSIVNIHLVDLAIVDSANYGTLQIVDDSTISYHPNQNYFGKDTITYAFDNAERRDSAITIITIYMLDDDPPEITSSDTSFAVEDEPYNYLYDGFDPDVGTNRWEIENVPTWLSMEDDSIIGIPLEGDMDTSFLLIYSDAYFSDTLEVGIFVTPVNDPPVIKSADSIIIDELDYYVYNASAEDPEDSTLTWIFSELPSWMSTAGDSSFGAPYENAPDTNFNIMVTDGEDWDSSTVFVDVIPYDNSPIITSSDTLLAFEDEFVTFNLAGFDPEGLPIFWSIDQLPSWLSMEGDDVSGIPREGDLDTLFTLFASDGTLNDTLVITVHVTPINDVPEITSHNIDTAYVDEYFVYYPTAIDAEDSTLSWELLSAPQWMIISGDSLYGLVTRGSDDTLFTFIFSDGELVDSLDVMLEVIDINYPPEIAFAQLIGEYHSDIDFSFHLYDFDDDDLDYDISFTTDGITWNNATFGEQSGVPGQDTMSVIWNSMSDLAGIYNSNVQLKILAYDLDTDTLQTPDDTSSIFISEIFTVDNHIGTLSVAMAETMTEYFGNIDLTYAIEDTTSDLYTINMNYSQDNGDSWSPATLQGNLVGLGIMDYIDSLTWLSDDDLFNVDTILLLEVSMSDGWQSYASSQIAIDFDNQFLPLLTNVQPDTGQYMYWYDTISLAFTGQMDLDSYSDGVILESNQRGVLEYEAEFIQSNEVAHLIINPIENYYTDELIQISINQQLRDVWNNPFDGNGNGDPDGIADEDSILFSVNLLGDYDRSSLVDFEDLITLQQNWWDETVTPTDEIGPALGTPPFMQIQPDSKMDFEDLMIFVQMWNWSVGFDYEGGRIARSRQTEENYTTLSASYPPLQVGDDVEELYLYVNLDSIQAVGALGLELSYDPEAINFVDQSSRFDQHWAKLSYHDSANHSIVIQLADLDQEIRIQPMNKQVKLKFHRLMDTETEVNWGIDLRDRTGKTREVFIQSYKFSTTAPLPEQYALHQNYPNPFNPSTTIRYDLPEDSHIRIVIYNILGQEVRVLVDGLEPAGFRLIRWYGKDNFNRNVSAGVYFLLMDSKDFTLTRKLILLK